MNAYQIIWLAVMLPLFAWFVFLVAMADRLTRETIRKHPEFGKNG